MSWSTTAVMLTLPESNAARRAGGAAQRPAMVGVGAGDVLAHPQPGAGAGRSRDSRGGLPAVTSLRLPLRQRGTSPAPSQTAAQRGTLQAGSTGTGAMPAPPGDQSHHRRDFVSQQYRGTGKGRGWQKAPGSELYAYSVKWPNPESRGFLAHFLQAESDRCVCDVKEQQVLFVILTLNSHTKLVNKSIISRPFSPSAVTRSSFQK